MINVPSESPPRAEYHANPGDNARHVLLTWKFMDQTTWQSLLRMRVVDSKMTWFVVGNDESIIAENAMSIIYQPLMVSGQ